MNGYVSKLCDINSIAIPDDLLHIDVDERAVEAQVLTWRPPVRWRNSGRPTNTTGCSAKHCKIGEVICQTK